MKNKPIKELDNAIMTRLFDDLLTSGVKTKTYIGSLNLHDPSNTGNYKRILGGLFVNDMPGNDYRVTVFSVNDHNYSIVQMYGGGWGFYGYVTKAVFDYDVSIYMIDKKETIGI
jgi:hypothetical protein